MDEKGERIANPETKSPVKLAPSVDTNGHKWEKMIDMVEKFKGKKGGIIPVLQQVQSIFNYVPEKAVDYIAKEMEVPPSALYGVLTFYAQFYTKPRGEYVIKACRGTACHVKGGKMVLRTIEDYLGISEGETTPDMRFTLETVACLGTCALAPVIIINQNYYGNLYPQKIVNILTKYSSRKS